MRKSIFALVFLVFCPLLAAQQTMNNEAVIKLVKAGLSDDLIVATINAQTGSYDTSADGLIALKTAGASDKVVAAIVTRASAPATPPSPAPAVPVAVDPNDPAAPHDPGIYLMTTTQDGKPKMVLIEMSVSAQTKRGLGFGVHMRAVIPDPHATVRTTEILPVFYMYFPPGGNMGGANSISIPSQLVLMYLESKKDHRETVVAKMLMAGNKELEYTPAFDKSSTVTCPAVKVRPYVYKVSPELPLTIGGEYAFIAEKGVSSSGSIILYDFGVDAK